MNDSNEFFGGIESISETIFSSFAGYGLLLLFIFCLIRKMPAAVASIPYMSDGVSNATTTPLFSYVQWLAFISVFVVLLMGGLSLKSDRRGRIKEVFKFKLVGLIVVLIFYICLKSVLDVIWLGLDEHRKIGLMLLIPNVLVPFFIILFSVPIYGWNDTVRQFMFGAYLGSFIWISTGIMGSIADFPIAEFFVGKRLVFHSSGVISSIRLVPLFLWASIFWLLKVSRTDAKVFILAGSGIALTALSLNGTRQYAVSVFGILCLSALLLPHRAIRIGLFCVIAGIVGSLLLNSFVEILPLRQRSTIDQVGSDGRFAIWDDSLEYALQYPWFGGGFRTYGEVFAQQSKVLESTYLYKDNAHGMFADIAVDHGFILSVCLAGFYLLLCQHLYRLAIRLKDVDFSLIAVGLMGLPLSLLFSGTFWSAFYFVVPIAFVATFSTPRTPAQINLRIYSPETLASISNA